MTVDRESEQINDTLKWLDNVCKMYAVGKEVYDMCADTLKTMPEAEMIVSPANLGDTVFIATLSAAYKKAHGIKQLLLVARNRQAEAAEWFEGVDNVVGIGNTEMICLRYYFTISRKYYENGIRYGHVPCFITSEEPGAFFHIPPGFDGQSLKKTWETRLLDLPEDSPTCNIRIPDGVRSENADKYKDAVLIAPAAFTYQQIPESFWEKLVSILKEKGHEVWCNSGGLDYDKSIGGTKEFAASTKELILNAPLFRHVIAVRSGFTDLVSKTDARLTVLHPGVPEASVCRVEYGSRGDDVRDLGRMEGIFPIVYVPGKEEEVIRLIMEDVGA